MRKMVTARTISAISPIPDADKLEIYHIDGWQVVGRKGEFKVGEKVLYCEIDACLPLDDNRFSFLKPRGAKTINGKEYHKLKTAKLRGALSQGLILPYEDLPNEDGDYSKALGVFKWEPPETDPYTIGEKPGWIPTTDEMRLQNLDAVVFSEIQKTPDWVATEKIDGMSTSIYCLYENGDYHFGVCSRNKELSLSSPQYQIAFTTKIGPFNVFEYLENCCAMDALGHDKNYKVSFVLQGEYFGEGIQKNRLGIKGTQILFFNFLKNSRPISLHEISHYYPELHNLWVPEHDQLACDYDKLPSVEKLIALPDGVKTRVKGANPDAQIEGFVWRNASLTTLPCGERASFKTISNNYLLKEKD